MEIKVRIKNNKVRIKVNLNIIHFETVFICEWFQNMFGIHLLQNALQRSFAKIKYLDFIFS